MNYAYGAAKRLYERKLHPRIFFGPADVPELRKNLAKDDGKKIMTAFRKQARRAVRDILEVEPPEKLGEALRQSQTPGYGGIGAVVDMALIAALDEDAKALLAVRRVLKFAPAAQEDPPANGQPRHRLGRCLGGPMSLAYDLVQPQLSTEERRAFCGWVYENCVKRTLADSLPNYYLAAGMNIPLGGLRNVLDALMAIDGEDGVPDLSVEWGHALRMFEATLNTAIGPDGYPVEDMGYGTSVTGALSKTVETLRRAGKFDAYKTCPQYAKFGDAMLHFVQPWGRHLSTTGDHGDDFGGREFVLARLAAETGNPALLWLLRTLSYYENEIRLGKGMQAAASFHSLLVSDRFRKAVHPSKLKKPPATHFRDRGRGIVTFRSGWRENDAFVVFDGSQRCPAAQGHEHASCGQFSISAFGEYFAIDTGRYNMEQNCHNVTLIDGKSGRSTDGEWISVKHDGILTGFQPGDFVDTASVDSSLQHNCFWARRHLGLVKGRHALPYVWVIDDINKNNGWGEYWWQLHTCPENRIQLLKTQAVITGWRHGNKMDVHFALPAPTEYDPPHRLPELTQDQVEPSSYKYVGPFKKERLDKFKRPADQIHYSTFIRPRLIAKIAGLNGRFMSLMLPRAKTMKPARIARLESLPGSLAVRIAFDRVEDTLIFAYEHRMLEAGDVRASGNWCVVRRDNATGKTLDYAIADGVMLAVGGKPLAPA